MSASTQPKISEFLGAPRPMLIGQDWVQAESGQTFDVFNPADGEVIARVAAGDAADVDKAVAAARAMFPKWSVIAPAGRARMLWKLADLIEANADELAELETLDNGKPFMQAKMGDIPAAAESFRYYAGWCTKIGGVTTEPSRPAGEYHAYSLKQPVGVAGLIVPWNFPLLMAAWKVAPALAAGCTAILKPAEQTPLTALRLAELALEAGIPPGVLNVVTGFGHTAGAAMAAHDGIDKIAFTGSTEVGKKIVQAATGNLKKVSLELGGKSPNIVMADANMETAIPGAAMSIFYNAGQVCVAGTRLFIEKKAFDNVMAGIEQVAKAIKVGPGMAEGSQMGPLVSAEQLDRVTSYIESGKAQGASIAFGGERIGEKGYFVSPTVMVNTTADMRIQKEEIFGPVATATPVEDIDEIAAKANDSIFGLAAYVWTNNLSHAHRLAKRLETGSVWINQQLGMDLSLPFGGWKQSGWGRENGRDGVELYLQTKSVNIQLA